MSFVRPRPLIVIVTAGFIALTVKLGFWQLDRGDAQAMREAQQATADSQPVAPWHGELGSAIWEHKVKLTGRWDGAGQVLLDNRIHNELPGYYVLTPLVLDDGRAVAVMRGWVVRPPEGVPTVPVPDGPVSLIARMARPEQHYLELSSETVTGNVWQNLNWGLYQSLVKHPLVGALAYQADGDDGLVRDWPRGDMTVERHYMYAGQWFLFAALAGALFVILHWKWNSL